MMAEDALSWDVRQVTADEHAGKLGKIGWFTASVRRGGQAGWALRETESEARHVALLRLTYAEDGYR